MRTYHQLTSEQRYQISALQQIGHTQTEIADQLEVHKSTINRELSRNKGERGYRPKQANAKAQERRAQAAPRKRILAETWEVVEEKLRQDWSPEQVSGWLKQQVLCISPEWIYQHILADQRTSGVNAMVTTTAVVNCPIGSGSKSDPSLWSNVNAWAIGKLTPWWASDTVALW